MNIVLLFFILIFIGCVFIYLKSDKNDSILFLQSFTNGKVIKNGEELKGELHEQKNSNSTMKYKLGMIGNNDVITIRVYPSQNSAVFRGQINEKSLPSSGLNFVNDNLQSSLNNVFPSLRINNEEIKWMSFNSDGSWNYDHPFDIMYSGSMLLK